MGNFYDNAQPYRLQLSKYYTKVPYLLKPKALGLDGSSSPLKSVTSDLEGPSGPLKSVTSDLDGPSVYMTFSSRMY